jgi:two-component system, chemotaxis family, CheB/CheR fusion protein
MSFHELATNATKYGALSVPSGRIKVEWARISDDRGEAVLLTWAESGGPIVRPPVRRSFGSTRIEHAVASEFAGEVQIAFPPQGVICTMRLPISDRLTIGRDAA